MFRKFIRNPICWYASGLLILAVPAWAGDKPAAVAVTGASALMPAIAGLAATAAADRGRQAGIDERIVQSMTKSGYDKEQVREEVGKGCDGGGGMSGDMAICAAYSYHRAAIALNDKYLELVSRLEEPTAQEEIAAVFSLRAYDEGVEEVNRPLTPSPWIKLDNPLPATHGFAYGIFRNATTNEVVIACRGTDGAAGMMGWDGGNNVGLYSGFAASQAKQAAAVYADVLQTYGADAAGSIISFTGHSLGGGLASIMSVWFNRTATVFDPAPLQSTAESGFTVNSVIASLGAFVPSAIRGYIPVEHFSNREVNVQSNYAVGEFLHTGRTVANTVYATNTPIQFGNADVGAFATHSHAVPFERAQSRGFHV